MFINDKGQNIHKILITADVSSLLSVYQDEICNHLRYVMAAYHIPFEIKYDTLMEDAIRLIIYHLRSDNDHISNTLRMVNFGEEIMYNYIDDRVMNVKTLSPMLIKSLDQLCKAILVQLYGIVFGQKMPQSCFFRFVEIYRGVIYFSAETEEVEQI